MIEEAKTMKFPAGVLKDIAGNAQSRYERLKPSLKPAGQLADLPFSVMSEEDETEARFYAVDADDRCVAYLLIRLLSRDHPGMMEVKMVFVMPKQTRRGIAKSLYRFALQRGYTLVSDAELTRGSRAVWRSLQGDHDIQITQTPSILDMHEKPLGRVDQAFRNSRQRMIARMI